MNDPSPGYKSSEGAAAGIGIGGPLIAVIASRDLTWQQVVALLSVALVACVYIGCRTWLKRAGVPVALALLLLASPALADGPQLRAPMPADVAAVPPLVPPEAIVPTCPPPAPVVKPAPSWATYLGFGLAAATEILTLAVTLSQRAP